MKAIQALKTTRRRFFGLAPSAAIAAKQVAEESIKNIMGGSGLPRSSAREALFDRYDGINVAAPTQNTPGSTNSIIDWRKLRDDAIRKALNTPERRAELESILYQTHRNVCYVDPDIAVHRSFSLAARLCYQRQRMVQREIADTIEEKSSWQKLKDWKANALAFLDKLG